MPKLSCHICQEPATGICDLPGCEKPLCVQHSKGIFGDFVLCPDQYEAVLAEYNTMTQAAHSTAVKLAMHKVAGIPATCPHGHALIVPCSEGCGLLVVPAITQQANRLLGALKSTPTSEEARQASDKILQDTSTATYDGPMPDNSGYKFDPSHVPTTFAEPEPIPGAQPWEPPDPMKFRH